MLILVIFQRETHLLCHILDAKQVEKIQAVL